MSRYSIKDLENLSGIKAHTLRMWEKRYGVIQPERTDTNIRYYTNEELKKVLNIAILNRYGLKISKIVGLSTEELHKKVLEVATEEVEENTQIESLVIAMVDLDEPRFEKVLANCTLRMGFEQTILSIVYPFFQKVGVLWQAGAVSPAQEHFISNLIRQKLIVAIDGQGLMMKENPKQFLLFLPEGEMHELGLLFYNYLIRKAGHRAVYLGQSVPIADVVAVNQKMPSQYIITSTLSRPTPEQANELLEQLLNDFNKSTIIVSNRLSNPEEIMKHNRLLINKSWEEFKALLG
jgi:DNA-binding transcriptional MerR regulator